MFDLNIGRRFDFTGKLKDFFIAVNYLYNCKQYILSRKPFFILIISRVMATIMWSIQCSSSSWPFLSFLYHEE